MADWLYSVEYSKLCLPVATPPRLIYNNEIFSFWEENMSLFVVEIVHSNENEWYNVLCIISFIFEIMFIFIYFQNECLFNTHQIVLNCNQTATKQNKNQLTVSYCEKHLILSFLNIFTQIVPNWKTCTYLHKN